MESFIIKTTPAFKSALSETGGAETTDFKNQRMNTCTNKYEHHPNSARRISEPTTLNS